MHFPWDAFTNTGLRTMLALQRVEHEPYKSVSALDALQVSILYECEPPRMSYVSYYCVFAMVLSINSYHRSIGKEFPSTGFRKLWPKCSLCRVVQIFSH